MADTKAPSLNNLKYKNTYKEEYMNGKSNDPDIFAPGASILITGAYLNGRETDLVIDEGGTIAEITAGGAAKKGDSEFILDADGAILTPAFTNTHTHAAMSLLRGYADDMHLQEWLGEKIWPLEAHLTADDVYWGTKLACVEMIRSGTVAFNDMYFFMDAAARAVDETGMKAVLAHGFIDFSDPEKREAEIAATEALIKSIKAMNNPCIAPAVGPHAPYTVSKEALSWCAECAEAEDILLHIHLSETEGEVNGCIEQNGMRPAQYLDSCGCLSERTVAAHCCWLDEDECRLMGERGVSVAHNPASNMKLAVGRAMPYQDLMDAGANVTLATDGCSSNNNLDMLEEVKFAALLQKFYWNSDTVLPADEAFTMMTSSGARALGLGTGIIEVGAPADLVLLSRNTAANIPLYNPVSNIVYALSGAAVETTICNGRVLMYDREVPGEEDVCLKAAETAASLVRRKEESAE